MATATKTKPKPATPAESLRNLNDDIRAGAAADWKRWAVALADGQGAPDGRELVNVAAALKIQDPANQLQAAADAIIEVRTATRGVAICEQTVADLLAPYGGDLAKLLAAVDAAKAEVERLQGIAYTVGNAANRGFYTSMAHHARLRHPNVWPAYERTGTAEEL
jgi:hypothetical protein